MHNLVVSVLITILAAIAPTSGARSSGAVAPMSGARSSGAVAPISGARSSGAVAPTAGARSSGAIAGVHSSSELKAGLQALGAAISGSN